MKNPIFIEYYAHEQCNCYKILNPWTRYQEHKLVLCPVSEGIEKATLLARHALIDWALEALSS